MTTAFKTSFLVLSVGQQFTYFIFKKSLFEKTSIFKTRTIKSLKEEERFYVLESLNEFKRVMKIEKRVYHGLVC